MPLILFIAFMVSGCTSYRVQQSALVPAATLPALPASQPAVADVYIEDSTVTFVSEPERAPSSDAGLWVTRHLLQVAASAHITDYLAIRMLAPVGLAQGAMRTAPTLLARPDKPVTGGGGGVTLSLPFGGGSQQLHFSTELSILSIPTRSTATCVTGCEGKPPVVKRQQRKYVTPLVLGLDYILELRQGARLAIRAGLRGHPVNHEVIDNSDGGAEVEMGPAYAIIGTSLEVQLADWLSITPTVQWPVNRSPIRYGPIISVGVRGTATRAPTTKSKLFGYEE